MAKPTPTRARTVSSVRGSPNRRRPRAAARRRVRPETSLVARRRRGICRVVHCHVSRHCIPDHCTPRGRAACNWAPNHPASCQSAPCFNATNRRSTAAGALRASAAYGRSRREARGLWRPRTGDGRGMGLRSPNDRGRGMGLPCPNERVLGHRLGVAHCRRDICC